MQLALIRGTEPGLCPMTLLANCAAGGGIDLITVPNRVHPVDAELVLVDYPDARDSLRYIRALRQSAQEYKKKLQTLLNSQQKLLDDASNLFEET